MTPDFESPVVLANTVRVLRSDILPALEDDEARLALIRIIAVVESHLAQLAVEEPDATDETTRRAALTALDGPMLMAFGGRLREDRTDDRAGPT